MSKAIKAEENHSSSRIGEEIKSTDPDFVTNYEASSQTSNNVTRVVTARMSNGREIVRYVCMHDG